LRRRWRFVHAPFRMNRECCGAGNHSYYYRGITQSVYTLYAVHTCKNHDLGKRTVMVGRQYDLYRRDAAAVADFYTPYNIIYILGRYYVVSCTVGVLGRRGSCLAVRRVVVDDRRQRSSRGRRHDVESR